MTRLLPVNFPPRLTAHSWPEIYFLNVREVKKERSYGSNRRRKPPTPEEIVAEQKRQAAKDTAARKAAAASSVPAKAVTVASTTVATPAPDTRTEAERYVDEIAPASIVGRMIKFSKDGQFVTADDDEPVDEAAEFIALCDEMLVGWIRFHRDGETPPDRVQGLLYDGFKVPPRETLGDMDETQWEPGLAGKPEDPWKHQMCLVLQQTETRELLHFRHHVGDGTPRCLATCCVTTTECGRPTPTKCRWCGCG